jgi:hypothetical protein
LFPKPDDDEMEQDQDEPEEDEAPADQWWAQKTLTTITHNK